MLQGAALRDSGPPHRRCDTLADPVSDSDTALPRTDRRVDACLIEGQWADSRLWKAAAVPVVAKEEAKINLSKHLGGIPQTAISCSHVVMHSSSMRFRCFFQQVDEYKRSVFGSFVNVVQVYPNMKTHDRLIRYECER